MAPAPSAPDAASRTIEHAASPSLRTVDAAATTRIWHAGDFEGTTMKVAAAGAASTVRSTGKRRARYQSWCARGRWGRRPLDHPRGNARPKGPCVIGRPAVPRCARRPKGVGRTHAGLAPEASRLHFPADGRGDVSPRAQSQPCGWARGRLPDGQSQARSPQYDLRRRALTPPPFAYMVRSNG